jgi:hypothetical protein
MMGPAMRALPNDTWREFVRLYCDNGRRNAKACYSAAFDNPNGGTAEVAGYRMTHDDRVQKAIGEYCERQRRLFVPKMQAVIENTIENESLPPIDRANLALKYGATAGMIAVNEHRHTHEHFGSDPDQLKRIKQYALEAGINVEQLLGGTLATQVIDLEPEEDVWE